MNKAIQSFLKFVPDEDWIRQSCGLPWLELGIDCDGQSLTKEATAVYPMAVKHRSDDTLFGLNHAGWRSLCLYGVSPEQTQESPGKKTWTTVADQCPHTVKFIHQHWQIDDLTGRIRFMWLEPGGYILPHHDRETAGFHECNVALYHPDGCNFRFLNYGNVPFKTNKAFLVDISNKHLVVNESSEMRIHLIVHARLKPGILRSSYEQNFYSRSL